MHPIRIGRIARSLGRRRGWRQLDVAGRARVSQQAVSLVETGQARRLSIGTLERVLGSLEAELDLVVRWRGGELDRLLDEGHAALLAAFATRLLAAGWLVETEVTYAIGGERGSIDLFAFHPTTATLLVVEVKAEVVAAEATLRKHDEKVRLGPRIARERLGWSAKAMARILVLPASSTARRRIDRHRVLFDRAYPIRGAACNAWLRRPNGAVAGLLFLPVTNHVGARPDQTSRRRIRRAAGPSAERGIVRGAIGFPKIDDEAIG